MGSQRPLFASYITHTPYSPFPHNGTTNNHWQFCDQKKKLVIWLNIVWVSNSTLDALALGKRGVYSHPRLFSVLLGCSQTFGGCFFPFSALLEDTSGEFWLWDTQPSTREALMEMEGGGIPFSHPKLVGLTKIHLAQPSCRGLLCQLQRAERECVREQGVVMMMIWW